MSKRAYGSAFFNSTPAGMLVTANGFDAPQPQLQQLSPGSSLYIPGQWPPEQPVAVDDVGARPSPTFFTTFGRWAATILNPANITTIPRRLFQRYWRKQQIKAVPVIRSDGSYKKRFIATGFANDPATPSPSVRARARLTRQYRGKPATSYSPYIGSPTPSPDELPNFTSPLALAQVYDDLRVPSTPEDAEVSDLSFEMSFDDVLTSTPLPPKSPQGDPRAFATASLPPVTPMRRHLLRLQLRASTEALREDSSPDTEEAPINPTQPTEEELSYLPDASPSPFQTIVDASPIQSDVNSSPFQTDVESSPFQTDVESSPFQSNVDSPSSQYNTPVAITPEYENGLSFLSDAPPLPLKKKVRWTEHAGARPFYCDQKVSEMLDATIEAINFSPVKPSWDYYDDAEDETDDESQSASVHSEASGEGHNEPQEANSHTDGGFHGVPADTWEDSEDSLDESQLSLEIIQDLQEDLQKKLALSPPTPSPPPPVKPLITPLTSEELKRLEEAAAKTEHGRQWKSPVVPEKQLLAKDFGTLLPHQFNGNLRAWLNDEIVNEYLAILVAQKKKEAGFAHKRGGPAPPMHAFSSFWYTTMKDRPESIKRWASRVQLQGDQYLDADLLLYPICDDGHWRLLAVKPKERTIEYLDSMGFKGDKYVKKLKEYLEGELKDSWNEDEWTVVELQRSSRQINGNDCGVFTLLNALTLLRGEEYNRVIACCGMADARERIAITLMAGHPTTELE